MAGKGFFEDLFGDFCKQAAMKGAIEASRDQTGRIDVAKAAGISMGLGNTSPDDIAMMGAMLGGEGAFDNSTPTGSVGGFPVGRAPFGALPDDEDAFGDTLIGTVLVSADDMELLSDAGYEKPDLLLMDQEELMEAMEDAGVDTDRYDFDD